MNATLTRKPLKLHKESVRLLSLDVSTRAAATGYCTSGEMPCSAAERCGTEGSVYISCDDTPVSPTAYGCNTTWY